MSIFGHGHQAYTLQSNYSPICNRRFTSTDFAHLRFECKQLKNFNNTVFMRKKIIPENVIKSHYWWFKRTENFEIIGLVV